MKEKKPKVVKKRDVKRVAVGLLEALLDDPDMVQRAETIIKRKKGDQGLKP